MCCAVRGVIAPHQFIQNNQCLIGLPHIHRESLSMIVFSCFSCMSCQNEPPSFISKCPKALGVPWVLPVNPVDPESYGSFGFPRRPWCSQTSHGSWTLVPKAPAGSLIDYSRNMACLPFGATPNQDYLSMFRPTDKKATEYLFAYDWSYQNWTCLSLHIWYVITPCEMDESTMKIVFSAVHLCDEQQSHPIPLIKLNKNSSFLS